MCLLAVFFSLFYQNKNCDFGQNSYMGAFACAAARRLDSAAMLATSCEANNSAVY